MAAAGVSDGAPAILRDLRVRWELFLVQIVTQCSRRPVFWPQKDAAANADVSSCREDSESHGSRFHSASARTWELIRIANHESLRTRTALNILLVLIATHPPVAISYVGWLC